VEEPGSALAINDERLNPTRERWYASRAAAALSSSEQVLADSLCSVVPLAPLSLVTKCLNAVHEFMQVP
jgi:hypothetical protein